MDIERADSIASGFKSFSKQTYRREEVLDEIFGLQKEIVDYTFQQDYQDLEELKLFDVGNYLSSVNEGYGHVADKELASFIERSKEYTNWLKTELSGVRGEKRLFTKLDHLRTNNYVVHNLELSDGESRTEIDALVITPKRVTIIEAKNTKKDIHIDDEGFYYYTGKYLEKNFNIIDKMNLKVSLLKKALHESGVDDIEIDSLLVFTNDNIKVVCENEDLRKRVRFVNMIAADFDRCFTPDHYSDFSMKEIYDAALKASVEEKYPVEFDVDGFKRSFADIMTIFEDASIKHDEEVEKAKKQEQIIPAKIQLVETKEEQILGFIALTILFPPYYIIKKFSKGKRKAA